jgi:hypothetical protein
MNEGEGLADLWDVTFLERWMMTSGGDVVCQAVRGGGIRD